MTVSDGTALVVAMSEGLVPLVRQLSKPDPLFWKIPGGRIQSGETPEEAARREFFEETGICLDNQKLVLLSQTPRTRHGVTFMQYLFGAGVPKELLAPYIDQSVTTCDKEHERHETRCFPINDLGQLPYFLESHLEMLKMLKH